MISDTVIRCSRRHIVAGLLLLCLQAAAPAVTIARADRPAADTAGHPFWSRYTLSKVSAVTLAGGTFAYGAGVWWVNNFRPFHFYRADWFNENLGVDKLGHAYTSYYLFHALNDILLWGDHDSSSSFWWAVGVAAAHGLGIEIGDGFSTYGFDYHDVAFNYFGLGYGVLQEKVPFFRNFEMKWSLYYPMSRRSFKINDLYDYHIYWMSARVHNLLPAPLRPYWPEWLQIAFGLGATDHVTRRTYVLSLDYNLECIPIEGREANLLKKLANMFHLPAPGVRMVPGSPPEFRLFLLH